MSDVDDINTADINSMDAASADHDEIDANDINRIDDEFDDDDGDDDLGNRIEGGRARSVLEYLAENLVDDTDSIEIELEPGRRGGVMLRLHVSPDDMGRVIGRRGRVAQAIRTIVAAAGESEGSTASVDIVD